MEEFYNRMNVRNEGKRKICDIILNKFNKKNTLVLDLGAGSCVIEQMLMENGFKGSTLAIDRNNNCPYDPENVWDIRDVPPRARHKFICGDLFEETFNNLKWVKKYKRVVIVLSAILHELNQRQLHELTTLIKLIKCRSQVTLLIREPVLNVASVTSVASAYKEKLSDLDDYKEYASIHKNWSEEVLFVNYCFLKSYGPGSWEREKHEGRFTYDFGEIRDFVHECGCMILDMWLEKDEFYKNTLPYGIYDLISCTGTLFVCI